MAQFQEDLRTLITSTTAISSLISTRCHYVHLPEASARPHVWFRVASDTEARTLDGVGGVHEASLDLECVGLTETSVQNVADAVKTKLDGFKGTATGHTVQAMFLSDKDDSYVPFAIQSDEGVHVIAFGVHCWYTT